MFLDSCLSYADFRMASVLPFNHVRGRCGAAAHRLSGRFRLVPAVGGLPAWAEPFLGLNAPLLPTGTALRGKTGSAPVRTRGLSRGSACLVTG